MGIGRFRSFDRLPGLEPLAFVFARQRDRIRKRQVAVRSKPDLEPSGDYILTIKGAKPAQIRLDEPPAELLLKDGEVGRRKANSA